MLYLNYTTTLPNQSLRYFTPTQQNNLNYTVPNHYYLHLTTLYHRIIIHHHAVLCLYYTIHNNAIRYCTITILNATLLYLTVTLLDDTSPCFCLNIIETVLYSTSPLQCSTIHVHHYFTFTSPYHHIALLNSTTLYHDCTVPYTTTP